MNKDSQSPVVSVIIPIYNVEDYLRECLDSVADQTLRDIEVICVDDGSTDRSSEIAAEYAEKFDNFKLIQKENGGLSSARNAGLDAATGRYVYFLDSDDYISLDMLEKLCEKADSENLDIIYFNTELLFENDSVRQNNQNYINYYTREFDYSGVRTGQSMFAMMRSNREFLPSVCLQLFRRSMIEDNHLRFYDGIIHEDNLFSFQCMILAQRVNYDCNEYYHRRMHGDSIMTVGKSIRNVEGYLVAYSEILAFMHNRQVEKDAFEQISEFLYTSIWGNGRRIYQSLEISEDEAVLTKGDFCAAHFLDMIKRSGETEFERSRLKKENTELRRKLQIAEDKLRDASAKGLAYCLTYLPKKLYGGIRCIKDHGFIYTVRRALGKVWNVLKAVDKELWAFRAYQKLTFLPRKVSHIVKLTRKCGFAYPFRAMAATRCMKNGAKTPLVSFILPVYNVEEFLEEGMNTLLLQSLKHVEIIAVDDGSTDRSLEILNKYAAEDSRVRVFTQKNQFAGAARNLGLANARGEYVVFLDSDDFFAKGLAKDAYFMAKANKADIVLFGAKHYNNATKKYSEAKWLLNAFLAPQKQPFCYKDCPSELYRITTPCPWTKMFRRQFVLDAGLQFQHTQNANDLYFTYSALAMAKRIVTLDRPLVYYRVGLNTNLQSTKAKHPFCFYEAYLAWHDKLEELGALDCLRQSYVNVALAGCMHNLRTNKDVEVKRIVFERLKTEIFEKLEISGHEEAYYYSKENYEEMVFVLNNSFEDYLERV